MLHATVRLWPRPTQLVSLRQITMASFLTGYPLPARQLASRNSIKLALVDKEMRLILRRAYSPKPKFRFITPCVPAGDASVQQRPTVQQLVKRISRGMPSVAYVLTEEAMQGAGLKECWQQLFRDSGETLEAVQRENWHACRHARTTSE
jgi:hypothetical protein